MAKVNLGKLGLSYVSENCTLPECIREPRYEGTFCME